MVCNHPAGLASVVEDTPIGEVGHAQVAPAPERPQPAITVQPEDIAWCGPMPRSIGNLFAALHGLTCSCAICIPF